MASPELSYERRNSRKPWSKSDIQRMIKFYPHSHSFQLARYLGRTISAVNAMALKLGIGKEYTKRFRPLRPGGPRWSDDDIRILKKMYYTHSFEEISDVIGRSRDAIARKAVELRLRKLKIWTQKEEHYLRRFFVQKSSRELSQKLGRTLGAIKLRAAQLGCDRKLKRWTDKELDMLNKYYPIMHTKKLAKLIGRSAARLHAKATLSGIKKDPETAAVDRNRNRRWTKREIEEINRVYKDHTIQQTADILGYPRKSVELILQRYRISKQRRWTKKEKQIIRNYYREMTYRKLAQKLGRSPKAVEFYAHRLGLIKEPRWTNQEILLLKKQFKKGVPVRIIAERLGRGHKSCDSKIKRLGLR